MKLTSIALPLFAFATCVASQASYIGLPKANTKVKIGEKLTVQIVKPDSIIGGPEVGLVLSFLYCAPPNPCPNATDQLGDVLYIGKLDAQFHKTPGEPYQNFTVTIPDFDFLKPAPAQIVETRFYLIGAGPAAVLETNTVTVQLVN